MTLRIRDIRWVLFLMIAATCLASPAGLTLNSPNSTLDGFGIGWLNFTDDATGDPLLLMCDDTTHEINYGLNYIYDYSTLGDDLANSTITNLEFGGQLNAATDYEAAAYLAWEYFKADPTGANATLSADYNIAIWTLFDPTGLASGLDPGDPTPANYQAAALSFVTNSANARALVPIYDNTTIYTPIPSLNSGSFSQEFFQENTKPGLETESPTPEPGTVGMVLGGMALVMLSRVIKRKRV